MSSLLVHTPTISMGQLLPEVCSSFQRQDVRESPLPCPSTPALFSQEPEASPRRGT